MSSGGNRRQNERRQDQWVPVDMRLYYSLFKARSEVSVSWLGVDEETWDEDVRVDDTDTLDVPDRLGIDSAVLKDLRLFTTHGRAVGFSTPRPIRGDGFAAIALTRRDVSRRSKHLGSGRTGSSRCLQPTWPSTLGPEVRGRTHRCGRGVRPREGHGEPRVSVRRRGRTRPY